MEHRVRKRELSAGFTTHWSNGRVESPHQPLEDYAAVPL